MNILLGSKSPRRKEILEMAGYTFKLLSLNVEETYPDELKAQEVPEYLAIKKASAYTPVLDEVLITCDTVVILDGEVLEKPVDSADALTMLKRLNGREHTVVSGLCIKTVDKVKSLSDFTQVKFLDLREEELQHYIEYYKPYDKAGSYGVQEWLGMVGVEYIRGSFYNVMGLPIHRLYQVLMREF